jgi:hypothetical protein
MYILPYFPGFIERYSWHPCPITQLNFGTVIETNRSKNFPTLCAVVEAGEQHVVPGGCVLLQQMVTSKKMHCSINDKTATKVTFLMQGPTQKLFHHVATCRTIEEMNAFAKKYAKLLPGDAPERLLHMLGLDEEKRPSNAIKEAISKLRVQITP